MQHKLKPKQVPEYRARRLKEQRRICMLCLREIHPKQAALDHCHVSGHCRSVLHKNCNGVEGRVLQWAKRSGVSPELFLRNLLQYWSEDYSENPLHPNHRTPSQKKREQRIKLLKKRAKKAIRESTTFRIRQEIRALLLEAQDDV